MSIHCPTPRRAPPRPPSVQIKTSLKEFTEETGTQCMDDSGAVQNIGVTCCDPMGIGHRPECLKSVSRIEAKEHCEKFNMTLCSAQALMNGAGEDDGRLGCDFDATMQWSSTHCDSPVLPHAVDKTMHGGAENVSTSANLSTTLATQATLVTIPACCVGRSAATGPGLGGWTGTYHLCP